MKRKKVRNKFHLINWILQQHLFVAGWWSELIENRNYRRWCFEFLKLLLVTKNVHEM